jgi:hypothetical protein
MVFYQVSGRQNGEKKNTNFDTPNVYKRISDTVLVGFSVVFVQLSAKDNTDY